MIFLAGTLAVVAYTVIWALSTHRPVRRRVVTGRPADPYWHSKTGLQDERGIVAMPEPAPADRLDLTSNH